MTRMTGMTGYPVNTVRPFPKPLRYQWTGRRGLRFAKGRPYYYRDIQVDGGAGLRFYPNRSIRRRSVLSRPIYRYVIGR